MQIKVYTAEAKAGLTEAIESNNTLAYVSEVSKSDTFVVEEDIKQIIQDKTSANSNPNQFDLYYLNSVLVSTGWNKNDDVFDTEEVWIARKTPEDKQFNFMHNEADIIGHITANTVIDSDGKSVEDNINFKDLPDNFDIVTSAVLYNSWSDPELTERMVKIISEIEEGKWFVSMECLFNAFDYAVVTPDKEQKIVARNEASAFLTKHLRAYGGTGEYEGYKVGRLLRNIAFSGKGLVNQPANPRSVILQKNDPFKRSEAQLVNELNIREIEMSDTRLESQIESLKAELAQAKQDAEGMKQKFDAQKAEEVQAQVESYEATISKKDEKITTLEDSAATSNDKVVELEEALTQAGEQLAEAQKQIKTFQSEAKVLIRRTQLIEAGATKEEIEAILISFAEATDDMFEEVVTLAKKGFVPFKKKDDKDEEDKDDDDDAKAENETEANDSEEDEAVAEEVLDNVVEEAEASLVDAGETDSVKTARTVATEWLSANVLKTANLND